MVKIRQNLMPESLYSWKSPHSMNPTRIVVHNTSNDASADNEIKYMNKSQAQGGVQTSFHYAVDDKEAVQGLPENRNGWHAGDGGNGKGNREGIAIEICYSKSGGDRFIKAEQNAVELIVDILKRYGWGIDKVTKHQDYAKKYCPHRTLDMGWDRFINMIKEKLDDKPATSTTPSLKYSKGSKIVLNGYLYVNSYGEGKGSKKTNYNGIITITNAGTPKPYHIDNLGWVAESDITLQPTVTYYKKCAKKYTSIVDALKSIGVDSSFSNRKKIAAKNNIKLYVGLSSQNTTMLNLLKAGKLVK